MIIGPRAKGLEPKTLHNIIRTLSVIFAQANEDGLVSHNPATKPSKLVRLKKVGEHLEVFAMMKKCSSSRWQKSVPSLLPFHSGLVSNRTARGGIRSLDAWRS